MAVHPNDVLAAVVNCITAEGSGVDPFGIVIVGSQGSGESQPCCDDGLLRVELREIVQAEDLGSAYGGNCSATMTVRIDVTAARCRKTFKSYGVGTDGGAAPPATVNEQSAATVAEGWAILLALLCCDAVGPVTLVRQAFEPPGGMCAEVVTTIDVDVEACCGQGS